MEEAGTRTRSFRYDDYGNRRVFLRSYPLTACDDKEENKETYTAIGNINQKKSIQKTVASVFQWSGEKVLVVRRFKHKLIVYFIACAPVHCKPPTS